MARPAAALERFLRAHPVALLLLLTPGIPEYLSGSSGLNALVLNPVLFLFQLTANLGLYGPGALLVYEAKVRWKKGWGTVLLLGGAYGILEEGVALSTLFDPKSSPVGSLGFYGHWLGVNWIWAAGIVPFHAIFSISLPILLLGLSLPETVGRSLLSKRRIVLVAGILAVDVLALMVVVNRLDGFWMGAPVFAGSLISIGALVYAARRVPAGALGFRSGVSPPGHKATALVGVAFFPAVVLTQSLGRSLSLAAAVDFVLVLAVQALFLLLVTRRASLPGDPRGAISLVAGLVTPIAILGVLSELGLPLILFVDVALGLFFRRLWRGALAPPESVESTVPHGMDEPSQAPSAPTA